MCGSFQRSSTQSPVSSSDIATSGIISGITFVCMVWSFLVFSRVLSAPFNAPQDHYPDIIFEIEQQARDLNLDLQRRSVDLTFVCGKARKSASPQIRNYYEKLVEKARQEARVEADNAAIARECAATAQYLGLMPRAVKVPIEDHSEFFSDVEQSPRPATSNAGTPQSISARPHLVFRVWDAASRTAFIDGGFVAAAFLNWPRPLPAPIALDDPSDVGKILTKLHLSRLGDTPVYISTASVSTYQRVTAAQLTFYSHYSKRSHTQQTWTSQESL